MRVALRVFLPFALGYLLSYLLRVINAVAGEPLARDLELSAGELGLLTSLFYAGFGIAQLPLGVLMDRFGPRRVEAATLVLLAIGAGMFAVASSFLDLAVGRFLMGVGASMCLMAPLTAYRRWFEARQLPFVNGVHLAFGALGGAIGGGPTDWLIGIFGWQAVFAMLAVIVLVMSAVIFLVVPAEREPTGRPRLLGLSREIGAIATSRAFWKVMPLSAGFQAAMLSIPTLWTGPWLRQVAGLPSQEAANWLSVYALSLIVGFVGTGWIMHVGKSVAFAERVVVWSSLAFVGVQLLLIVMPPEAGLLIWIPYNILGAGSALTYAILVTYFAPQMAGRVNTTLNFAVFLVAFAAQWLFGVLLDQFPDGAGGYLPEGFQIGFVLLVAVQVVSFLPWIAIRAERCEVGDSPSGPPPRGSAASDRTPA